MACWLLLNSYKYDIIHAQTAQSFSILALLKPLLKSRLVFTRRTAFNNKSKPKRQLWKWSKADALVAISQAAALLPRQLGLDIKIIPSAVQIAAVNIDAVKQIQTELALENKTVLFTAAALSQEKDPFTLIRAVDILRQTFPDIICLHCGAEGAVAAQAKQLVIELGLENHYLFLGFQNNIPDYLSLADIYISSSTFEALGTSVLDACLAGVPVVASEIGGHKEILEPDYGLLAQAQDAAAFAKKITWLIQHPEPAQKMAKRAQEMVSEQYSVPSMVASYEKLYKSLL